MALQSKLILVFSILLGLFILQWALYGQRERSLLTEEMEERARVLVRTLSELAREPLITRQISRIDQQLQSIRGERDVVWARVADRNHRIVSDTRKDEVGWILSGPLPASLEVEYWGNLLRVKSPIVVAEAVVGMAEVAFSLEPLSGKIARSRRIFLGTFAFQLAVGALMFLLLQRQVFRPLETVLRSIVELPPEPETLRIPVPKHASPEIVAMVGAVQNMRERLVAFQKEAVTEARFSVMGKLASHMAHEIRNPLEAISGAVELVDPEVRSPAGREYISVIREEIEVLNEYLKEVLELTKPEIPRPVPTDLYGLLQETLVLMNPVARKRGVQLSLMGKPVKEDSPMETNGTKGSGGCLCLVDRSHLKRVFVNLILNAIEASSAQGEVRIVLETKEGQGWVRIRDSGCGISPDALPRVFEPYFTTKQEGTGLGLPISKRIVERHGGSMGILSNLGMGTEVWVQLPLYREGTGGTDPVGGRQA